MSSSTPEPSDAQKKAAARLARLVPNPANPTGGLTAFMNGSIRKALCLEMKDLRFGLRLAADRMRRGDFAEALQFYIALVVCEPTNAEFQAGLANCAMQMGENRLAVQAASVVIAIDPENYKAYYISGRANLALRQRDEAEEDLNEALALAEKANDAAFAQQIGALLRKLTALKTAAAS